MILVEVNIMLIDYILPEKCIEGNLLVNLGRYLGLPYLWVIEKTEHDLVGEIRLLETSRYFIFRTTT